MGSGSLTNDATYTIELSGSKTIPYYQLISENLEVIDMMFDSIEDAKQKEFCDYINSIGAKFMLSNSSAPLIYDLYSDYQIDEVLANRAVNCKASGRGKVTELVIRNYG